MADSPNLGTRDDFGAVVRRAGRGAPAEARAYSLGTLAGLVRRRRWFFLGTIGGLLLLCLAYCVVAPNQYEARASVALRVQPVSSLNLDAAEPLSPASILSTPLQLETLVNELRGGQLAWRVITGLKLYESEAFVRGFAGRYPGFRAANPGPAAQGYLLDRFAKRLHVSTVPRTLLVEVRFRSHDAALSAAVVNTLIADYRAQESESRTGATREGAAWLDGQLTALAVQVAEKEKRLAAFEREHGFVSTQQETAGGAPVETLHDPAVQQIDEAGRLLAAATGERILREALYRQAQLGDPEQVLAANPELEAELGPGGAALAAQLRTQMSTVGVELAELKAEHGANFPRVVELGRAQADLEAQLKAADASLTQAFERTWRAAADREGLLRQQMDARMAEGMKQNDAAMEYSVLHGEVVAEREMQVRLRQRMAEAGLAAGVHASSIRVVDPALTPYKPVAPDAPVYLAITLFAGIWVALAGALALDILKPPKVALAMLALCVLVTGGTLGAQAPTPSTQGIPTGVVKLPADTPLHPAPNAKDAPATWNGTNANGRGAASAGVEALTGSNGMVGPAMALPIAAGDFVEVSEFHTPEFHSAVRVAGDGTVMLPLAGRVNLLGLSEQAAAGAIERALVSGGMLLHPQVTVLVTSAAGQDVSVLGEVVRPGVYAYAVHHRLLDLISTASGLGGNAGRLVNVFHREDPQTAHLVVLASNSDASGSGNADGKKVDTKVDHNPELEPGDTVVVSRAGLVYVIGDVVRPGGFAVDPVQGLTVVQALSLAWGATPNAAQGKAILIRDQPGGRTLTMLNLRRMIRGQDPDQPVRDRDILFVPDSAAKDLLHKTLESAIQSAVGVSIYAGLVYSQRF